MKTQSYYLPIDKKSSKKSLLLCWVIFKNMQFSKKYNK